jgi:flavin-dependent dehydrogenase
LTGSFDERENRPVTARGASVPELRATRTPEARYDVAILGGGLAGLTLALQLKRRRPETSVLVAEKRADLAPDAAFKVGESTLESGAHYFRDVLGLTDHLDQAQLRKTGLRVYFPAGDNSDIAQRVEFVTPRHADVYTYQIDRGRFENELFERCLRHGADAIRGCTVREVKLGAEEHRVVLEHGGGASEVGARWLVDATGRANLLRRQLGLERDTDHDINAAWLRLAGGLDVEGWSDDTEWLDREPERGLRKHATIHLTGEGYWVWLIQLVSGPISIGVCADPRFHPFEEISELDRLLEWLGTHEPQLATEIASRREDVLDFLVVQDFSYACERVYSPERWCLTGEAGLFADPLYSPGSDFIAYGNTLITDLVARDLDGEDVTDRIEFFNFFLFRMFDSTLNVYRDQYGVFGNPQVMVAKLLFDTTALWSFLANLSLHGKIADPQFIVGIVEELQSNQPVLYRTEQLFREWHALAKHEWTGVSVLCTGFQHLLDVQADLVKPFEKEELRRRIVENFELLRAMAVIFFHKAAEHLPEKPGDDVPINAQGISLQPECWQEDGLFDEPGITLASARERLRGIEEFFLDERVMPRGA